VLDMLGAARGSTLVGKFGGGIEDGIEGCVESGRRSVTVQPCAGTGSLVPLEVLVDMFFKEALNKSPRRATPVQYS
jgi:hypothetical protein